MKIPFLGGLGLPELIIILVVVLLIFGPKNLPKLGSAIGRAFKGFRAGLGASKGEKPNADADADVIAAEEKAAATR